MSRDIHEITAKSADGRIYATFNNDGRVRMVCLGDPAQVRYWYNQIACLVGGFAVQQLSTYDHTPGAVITPATKPPGHWEDKYFGVVPVGSPDALFRLAACGPNPDADRVGYMVFNGSVPEGMWRLKGISPFQKAMSEWLGRVFYDGILYPMAMVGSSAESTIRRRTLEAISAAKRAGIQPYDEPALLQFLDTLATARYIQFIHEVSHPV